MEFHACGQKMVFVPSIRPPSSCANLLNSFAPALVQISLCLGSLNNCRYSSNFPMSSSRTGQADCHLCWAMRSAIDVISAAVINDGACILLFLTLSTIDSGDAIIVGCFGIGVGWDVV